MMQRFTRYELRTTDADAARAFYTAVLGHDSLAIWPLHEQARARGAVPHWLGHLALGEDAELEQVCQRFETRGAARLGPLLVTPDRGQFQILRDPGGAILALNASSQPAAGAEQLVVWHVLNTRQLEAAILNYQDLFGWKVEPQASQGAHGTYHEFAWSSAASEPAGSMGDIAGRPELHAHWLFFFAVDALDAAVARVREAGGTASAPFTGSSGLRFSVCEDGQRAAFGLCERR